MAKVVFSAAVVAACTCMVLAKSDEITLNLNYAAKPQWNYSVGYESQCIFADGKTTTTKKTEMSCVIKGLLNETKDRLDLTTGNLELASELYDKDVKAQIAGKLGDARYSLALISGYPTIDTVVDLSPDGLPEWNLYMQLAKLLPDMPQQPVRKGFSWERQATLPIKSSQGAIQCEVFRQFKIDSFSPKKDSAYISWKFSYAAKQEKIDSSSVRKYVPVAGSGTGKAVMDVVNGIIIRAEMDFVTPVVKLDKVKVNWKEKAVLEYVPER